jgi:hypothetical protein
MVDWVSKHRSGWLVCLEYVKISKQQRSYTRNICGPGSEKDENDEGTTLNHPAHTGNSILYNTIPVYRTVRCAYRVFGSTGNTVQFTNSSGDSSIALLWLSFWPYPGSLIFLFIVHVHVNRSFVQSSVSAIESPPHPYSSHWWQSCYSSKSDGLYVYSITLLGLQFQVWWSWYVDLTTGSTSI